MISHIVRFTKGNRVDTQVFYSNGKVRRFREIDNMPKTVLKILLDGECYETKYTETGKIERFR